MKIYSVGGAVRDELLGLPVKDRDYVVVGSTVQEMVQMGFRPVGKDFPVFLHPETHEEYALARTERKTALGYKGFEIYASPTVTLADDLARRDLTINAMAKDAAGRIIDPFGGVADLEAGIMRHVSPAFAEDPVRILRVARFAARFGFAIAPETLELMRKMVHEGEVEALVAERVWQELARGLMEKKPSRMFYALRESGALSRIIPEVDALFGVPQSGDTHPEIDTGLHVMLVLDYAAAQQHGLSLRFAALTHDLGKGTTDPELWPYHHEHEIRGAALAKDLCLRIRAPNDCRDLAVIAARQHGAVHRALRLAADEILALLEQTDAFRKPERFMDLLEVCKADARGRPGYAHDPFPQAQRLAASLQAALKIDLGAAIAGLQAAEDIREKIREVRLEAIGGVLAASAG